MNKKLKSRIVKNSAWALISSVIGRVGSLLFTIILARFLLPEKYGIYSIVFSVGMIFITFTDLGIDRTFIRYLSYSLSHDKKKTNAYYRYLLRIKIILALTAAVALAVLAYPIATLVFRNAGLFYPLLAAAFYIFVLTFEGFYSSIFYSIERVDCLSMRDILSQSLKIILALGLFIFVSSSYQLVGVFAVLTLTSIVAALLAYFYTKKLNPEIYIKKDVEIDKKKVIRFVGFLTIASISGILFSYIDSIMLGLYVSPEFVGFYRAAFSLVFGVAGLLGFASIVLMPVFTKTAKNNIQGIFSAALRYISILSIPCTFGLIALGNYFIRLFYGYAYLPSVLPIYFLAFAILPISLTGMIIALFSAEERTAVYAKIFMISSIVNIILNFALITLLVRISPLWASGGAAIATTVSWFFYMAYSSYFAKKEFGIRVDLSKAIRPFIAGVVMFFAIWQFIKIFSDVNILNGMATVLFGMALYFFVLVLLGGVNRADLELMKKIFQKK